jgi:F-type H+-transporting ATPase subunit a
MRNNRFFVVNRHAFVLIFALFSFVSINALANTENVHSDSTQAQVSHTDSAAQGNAHAAGHDEEEKFNPSELILEHIADSYDWHLWGHTSIHLPVILYTDKGLEVFSSGKFNHGHDVYAGKNNYKIEHNHIVIVDAAGNVDEAASKKVLDFSITKNVASLLLSVTLLIIIFLSVASAYRKTEGKAPKGFQSMIEPVIIFVRDEVAKPNLGYKYGKFMPFLLTIFFFIWMNNMLGLVPFFPGGANVSGNIAFTMVLAVITFIVININGSKAYWGHIFKPHVPLWMYPLMIPVEIVGIFTKPVALMIRLFANITAGHILILSLISLIFIFKSALVATVAVPFAVFISVIELLVAFLQAFIFTMLAALFIGMAIEEPHADH